MLSRLSRPRALALCALPVLAVFGTAAFAPLPFTLAEPGLTADVLGNDHGKPVITIEGAPTRTTEGRLRMTTIVATGPSADVRVGDVIDSWFRTDRAVMPRDAVYPTGGSEKEIERHNLRDMKESQNVAVDAALAHLGKDSGSIDVTLNLADVGGPSAGLFFSLGIIDKLVGDGAGGDLTGGRSIAGTGTISADGKVGAVGGVSLKTQAARRDGATVFLVPKAECGEARAELPKGLRLVPVTTLSGAVSALRALEQGGEVPSC
ncbi:S16 family serine protease [Streptomyces fulvorobeus]|uniref:PDZ domain-containing protein n=1 Tax=Streptomyces fulvorobeus TaxID=284028 RepID=A0A7Y9KVR6_9ACTN|nr:S16 family serine protease [Streptomyces fulvorobeus]NYE41084.1 PDZ domain-containing protein [Streptomyces fulvorobeus]